MCTPNARGGFSPKIHLRTNAKGDPLIFHVTSGEAHEVKGYDALMRLHEADPSKLLGDKGWRLAFIGAILYARHEKGTCGHV